MTAEKAGDIARCPGCGVEGALRVMELHGGFCSNACRDSRVRPRTCLQCGSNAVRWDAVFCTPDCCLAYLRDHIEADTSRPVTAAQARATDRQLERLVERAADA